MTTDIGRVFLYFGLIISLCICHGECKGELPDANQDRKADDAKLANSIGKVENSKSNADSQTPINDDSSRDAPIPFKIFPSGTDKFNTSTIVSIARVDDENGPIQKSVIIGDEPSTSHADIFISTKASKFTLADRRSDDRMIDDVKKKLHDVKTKATKKSEEAETEVDDGESKSEDEDDESNTKLEKPVILSSRGKLRFQFDNSITESVKVTGGAENGNESETRSVDGVTKLPLIKSNLTNVSVSDLAPATESDKAKSNATRAAKSSFHYQGGDGYSFENQFAIDADRDDSKFEDRVSTYPINDPGNNIDRVRNFNENSGNVKLKNIVRKPQGFSLTTESSAEADLLRRTVTRINTTTGKRRPTESPSYVAKPETATEASSTAIGKNEIIRKPSMKPSSSYSSRRRVSSTTALNDNSLPTTSTAWALASLKTPANVKTQKRPSEVLKKNVAEVSSSPKPAFTTTIKPFKSWSVKLQKTTTESPTDIPTTMKPLIEVDAETLSPIAVLGPVLMNMSEISSPKPIETTKRNEIKSETTDIHIDLMEDSHKPFPILGTNSSHVEDKVTDSMRYNYMVGNSTNDEKNTSVLLNIHQNDEINKPTNFNDNKDYKNDVKSALKPSFTNLDVPLNDEASKVEVSSSTAENLSNLNHNSDILNDVKSPSEVNELRNATETPSSSEVLRVEYQNTESNIIFDQIFKMKDEKNVPVKQINLDKNTTETDILKNIDVENITKNFDVESDKRENLNNATGIDVFDNKEVVTEITPTYDIEIDDDSPTLPVNGSIFVNIKDNLTSHQSTPKMFPSTEKSLPEIPSTIPTLKLTTKTESLDDIITTTRRIPPKRIFSVASIMTARPSTTMEMITTNFPFEEFTTSNSYISSTKTTDTRRKNTKLSPATQKQPQKSTTEEASTMISTSSTIRTTEESKTQNSKFNTTEKLDPVITISTSTPKPVLPASTEQVEVYAITDKRPSTNEIISSENPLTEITIIETTYSSVDDWPMAPTFRPKLPPESVPAYLMLIFKSSFARLCQTEAALKENLFQYITERSSRVQSKDQVVMVVDPEQCKEPDDSPRLIPVALYVVDDLGSYDKTLIDEMQAVLDVDNLNNYTIPIHKIVYQPNFVPDNSRVIAAMIITSIAAVCFVLLIFLMCTIRNRQKSSYGQRCTPVSVDDYNLDNISEYNNSIRRKGAMRASKRSYGNPAFDDPLGPSKQLTYNGLLKACENRCALDEEFSQIPTITVKPEELPPGAEIKNRYANIIPLPETRVSLSNNCSDSIHDYINANYVKGFKGADKFYIACQAPLQHTIEDFWKMIWKEQAKVVIMVTALSENGVEKCADYLPPSEVLDCHRLFGDYQVTLKKREVKEKYVISSLQLKNMENNLWREVTHLWYTSWPAQGVPNEQSSIIALLIEARAYMRNSPGPHVVHCSPGTGRTGTVIACDICIRDYELTRSVNIPLTVAKLRRCRAGAVQTKEQYAFIYKVLTLYAKKLNGGTPLESL